MLTCPITMIFWKIVKDTRTRTCVVAWAAGPHPPRKDQEVCPCLECPGASALPSGAQDWDPTLQQGGQSWDSTHHPRGRGTAAPEPLCSGAGFLLK